MSSNTKRFDRYKQILLEIINKHLPGCKVYLFGSRARSTNQPGADIDLALDIGKDIDLEIILNIQNEIEDTTIPLIIDLIDLHSISNQLKNEIKREGIIWKT